MMGGMAGMGAGMPNMQQMMADAANNPMVQALMQNPEFIRSMMQSNPAIREVGRPAAAAWTLMCYESCPSTVNMTHTTLK